MEASTIWDALTGDFGSGESGSGMPMPPSLPPPPSPLPPPSSPDPAFFELGITTSVFFGMLVLFAGGVWLQGGLRRRRMRQQQQADAEVLLASTTNYAPHQDFYLAKAYAHA